MRSRVALVAFVALAACKGKDPPVVETPTPVAVVATPTPVPTPAWLWEEKGDLAELKTRGKVRVLMPRQFEGDWLPRKGFPLDFERDAAAAFAKENGVEIAWVYVDSHEELIPWLLEGKGDVIAANMTVTPSRKAKIGFTVPVGVVREQVVTRTADVRLKKPADLAGRKIAVRRSSSFFESLSTLKKKVPKLEIIDVPESMETEEILQRVAEGEYDVTVADTNVVEAVFSYRDDLKVAFDLSQDRTIAWGVRPNAKGLKAALDKYLNAAQVSVRRHEAYKEDLPGIERRKVLRVLTRNSAATYFLWKGEVLGFEYELAREFAKKKGLTLEIVVAPSREDLFTWLEEGRGDVIAASMTRTPERLEKFWMSRSYNKVSEVLVSRASFGDALEDAGDLNGRTVVVRKSSSYWSSLEKFKEETGIEFTIMAAPEDMETEEIIAKVGKGEYDLTVADGHIVDIELTWRTDVIAAFPIGDPQEHGWIARKSDKKLQAAIDEFLKREYKGVVYNLAYRKYFKDSRKIRDHAESRSDRTGAISPYDDLIKKYSAEFGFDWRLVAAQMYRESRFDPSARSWVGAMGLMQVMPRTARELGFDDVVDPENGVHAGVEYLAWVRERFERELPVTERTWFALAAYNCGFGHVLDARRLAKEMKLDPNKWFGNVEKAMLRLSEPAVAKRMRFGYARGQEPVDYVREIRERFDAYARVAPASRDIVAGVSSHKHEEHAGAQ